MKKTDALIIGAGPTGLFTAHQLKLIGLDCEIVDNLDKIGGQCIELYPDKPIYDIPAVPECTGEELTNNLLNQLKPFDIKFHLSERVEEVKKEVKLPILCKDFFVDPYQVYLAKSFGADAILIILAAIDEKTSKDIFSVAEELNINTIVEVHTQEEAKKALYFKNSIIGINNRNLKTLETDLKTTYDLHKDLAKHEGPIICESGIKSEKEVEEIVKKTKINNFLIGESLLKNINENTSLLEKIVQISP